MGILYVLVPLALLLAGASVAVFVWAVRSGQFDDLDTPAVRVLFEQNEPSPGSPNRAALRSPEIQRPTGETSEARQERFEIVMVGEEKDKL